MICLTGAEQTVDALARRLERHRGVGLQEVRLDLLATWDDSVYPLLCSPQVVATCRAPAEGGRFGGCESERLTILHRALDQQPGYLDLELATACSAYQALYARRGRTRIILSHHGSAAGALPSAAARMRQTPADLLKLAVSVDDAAQLADLLRSLPAEQRPVLRIGVGQAGLLSRALYRRFGSPWTYVASEGALSTAPGQLTLAAARGWRLTEAQTFTPLGLIGGRQIACSPGPRVYNQLFGRRHLPYLYLPVQSERPADSLTLLEQLGFAGCSVTMPAKEQLLGAVDELSDDARQAGALNTICFTPAGRSGHNTDVPALSRLLASARGMPALVLGAGGAARAAVVALQQLGCPTTVCARRPGQAQQLAEELGARRAAWETRAGDASPLVINATPCGSDGCGLPLPVSGTWSGRLLLDMVLAPAPTPLMQAVAARGGRTLAGWQMWVEQGARQLAQLIGLETSAGELASLYHDAEAPDA